MKTATTPDLLELSRAELCYLLFGWGEDRSPRVQMKLRLPSRSSDIALVGLESLVDRGLVSRRSEDFVPSDEVKVILWGLWSADVCAEVAIVRESRLSAAVIFEGPTLRLGCTFREFGRCCFGIYPRDRPMSGLVAELVTVPLIDAGEALALVRVADGHSGVVAAVSVDEFGNWRMSDSKTSPKAALETDAERARAAIAGLVDRITADSVHVSNGGAA